jgi:hypothetical protein
VVIPDRPLPRALSLRRDEDASKAKRNTGVKKHGRPYLEQYLTLPGETTERKARHGLEN